MSIDTVQLSWTHLKIICRICLNIGCDQKDIFSCAKFGFINAMLMECAPIVINIEDRLPKVICNECLKKLELSYGFRRLCVNSDLQLQQWIELNPNDNENTPDQETQNEFGSEVTESNGLLNTEKSGRKKFRKLDCKTCGKNFRIIKQLREHEIECMPLPHRTLVPSNETHDQTKRIRKRTKIGPKKVTLLPDNDGYYNCVDCSRKYKYKQDLERHVISHTDIRYGCDDCGKEFTQLSNLKRHRVVHSESRLYACEFCGKTFRSSNTLLTHRTIHSNIRPHKCLQCNKSFRLKKVLDNHVRTHTGERPFVCETCGKSFARKHHMVTHRQIHGSRRFKCDMCNSTFITKQNLNQHTIKHFPLNMCEIKILNV